MGKFLILLYTPVVAILILFFGQDYTYSRSDNHVVKIFTLQGLSAIVTITILISVLGWLLLFLTSRYFKQNIALWEIIYYWLVQFFIFLILLLEQAAYHIS